MSFGLEVDLLTGTYCFDFERYDGPQLIVDKDTTHPGRTTRDDKLCVSSNDQTGIIRHRYEHKYEFETRDNVILTRVKLPKVFENRNEQGHNNQMSSSPFSWAADEIRRCSKSQ